MNVSFILTMVLTFLVICFLVDTALNRAGYLPKYANPRLVLCLLVLVIVVVAICFGVEFTFTFHGLGAVIGVIQYFLFVAVRMAIGAYLTAKEQEDYNEEVE